MRGLVISVAVNHRNNYLGSSFALADFIFFCTAESRRLESKLIIILETGKLSAKSFDGGREFITNSAGLHWPTNAMRIFDLGSMNLRK